MSSRPTISDVAREAGVSRTTVSHALRGIGQVRPDTRRRVEEAAARLGYRPSVRAQSLRLGSTRSIALMSSMPAAVSAGSSRLGFFMELAAAAAESALLRGYSVVLVPPTDAGGSPFNHLDVDGAILVEPTAGDSLARELELRHLPYVAIGRQPGSDVPHVEMRGDQGTRLLLEHLREQGATQVALVLGSSERHSYLDTLGAYEEFCATTGQTPVVCRTEEELGEQGAREQVAALLASGQRFDALCVVVDTFASGALDALSDAGITVPDDVMVATRYDGLRAKLASPPLTALDLHLPEVAAAAVDLLLSTMQDGPADEAPGRAVEAPPTTLVPRASTRC